MGRVVCLACLIAVGGCHSLMTTGERTSAKGPPATAGERNPVRGPMLDVTASDPLRGSARPDETTSDPLRGSARPDDDPLEQAADCLGRGDRAAAVGHLAKHVDRHPDQVLFRLQLAELLFDQDRFADAGRQYETAVAYAQDGSPAVRKQLVHCHTRLMEVAQATADPYAERLHRGIGLYLVGVQLADRADAADVERLLCKAAAELKEAQAARPTDARAAWYLYRVWVKLDQPRPAERALRLARTAAPFAELTASEARELALAR